MAQRAGVRRLWYKDEANRFGVGSFKALGGAYGVLRVIQGEVERLTGEGEGEGGGETVPTGRVIMDGAHRELA